MSVSSAGIASAAVLLAIMACAEPTPPAPPAPVATELRLVAEGSTSIVAGGTLQLTASVLDQRGAPMLGQPLSFSVEQSDLGSVTPQGLFTSSGRIGSGAVRVSLGSLAASVPINVVAGPPSRLVKVSGDNQSGVSGSGMQMQMFVRVVDAFDNALGGVNVSWTVVGSIGAPLITTTDANGETGAGITPTGSPRTITVQAIVGSLPPATFLLTILPSVGSLRVSASGLPDGTFVQVGIRKNVGMIDVSSIPFHTPAFQTVSNLPPGQYTLTWPNVAVPVLSANIYRPSQSEQTITIQASETPTVATMHYSQ